VSDISDHATALASVDRLAQRHAEVPAALRLAAEVSLPALHGAVPRSVATTGVGASEGPARLLASTLCEGGVLARFVPLMTFALRPPSAELLVVFSQNLSPNAQLALTEQHGFSARWLVTSLGFASGSSAREAWLPVLQRRGVTMIRVPPAREEGMLVRLIGPTVASLIALRLAAHLGARQLDDVVFASAAEAYQCANVSHVLDAGRLALVAAGVAVESLVVARCKILETLLDTEPSVWDVLQLAHGPLQAFHPRAQTLLVCSTPSASDLVARMLRTLDPERHRVIHVASQYEDALSGFEHMAAVDACLLATLRCKPRNLFDWPARGIDGPLYDLEHV
jgi:creatinine amidohydrolase